MPIHIEANTEDVAEIVILVGNPQRAEYIANHYLKDTKCYNSYRLMYGYTGTYNNKKVSVQTTGMGSPSLSIIVEELIMLGAKTLIRLGTAGAIHNNLELGNLVVATAAHSSHDIYKTVFPTAAISAVPDFKLAILLDNILQKETSVHTGPILTSETFYEDTFDLYKKFASYGTLAVEMESYPLFLIASKHGVKAATVLTLSDIVFEKQRGSKEVIKNGVDIMTKGTLQVISDNYEYLTNG